MTAAPSYDACVGFIDTLPATIATQGTWCLRQELTTSASSGDLISIHADNVTIDCNNFTIDGEAAGISTTTVGIRANGHRNLTIRNCTIRGFALGIGLTAGGGYLIENNRLDQSRSIGIRAEGSGSVIRRNLITNSGGSPQASQSFGIWGDSNIVDNIVDGISGAGSLTNFGPIGIHSTISANGGRLLQGNRVRNLVAKGAGSPIGIQSWGAGGAVRDNVVSQPSATPTGTGIACADNTSHVRDNVILNYATGIQPRCDNAGGNSIN